MVMGAAVMASAILALGQHPTPEPPRFPELSPKSIIQDCGAPRVSPDVCRVRWAPTPDVAEQRLGAQPMAWWAEDDQFYVLARRNVDGVRISGAVNLPMARLPGTDIWTLTLKAPRLEEGMIDMLVLPLPPGADPELLQWRGSKAPPKAPIHRHLSGRLLRDEIDSRAMGEKRGLTVYLPPGFSTSRRYPVAYFADGGSLNYWARVVEPLIASGKVRPVVLVGLNSGDSETRSRDYLPGWKGSEVGFEKHERFLLTEVMPRAEALYGASTRREDRLLTGKSNGAAWAVATALRNPELFGAAAGVSLGWPPARPVGGPFRPRLFLATGLLEDFLTPTRAFATQAQTSGHEVVLVTPVSGHGQMIQDAYLDDVLLWAFGRAEARAAPTSPAGSARPRRP